MRLEQLISNPDLPSLPEAIIKLNELINSDARIDEMAAIIEREPSLSSRTLELANSAWFKRAKTIESVNEAIALIGVTSLYHLIFATSVTRIFSDIPTDHIDMRMFWSKSVRTATLTQALASQFTHLPQNLFTSGLILYTGQLALLTVNPSQAKIIYSRAYTEEIPLYRIENEVLGYNHSDIAAALFEKWKLPASIYMPVKYYIDPMNAPEEIRLTSIVLHIANFLNLTHYAMDNGHFEPVDALANDVIEMSKLNDSKSQRAMESAANLYDEALAMLGI